MSNIAKLNNKIVSYRPEQSFGTIDTSAESKDVRYISTSFEITEEQTALSSLGSYQQSKIYHGVRNLQSRVSGELSAVTYADFLSALLGRDYSSNNPIYAAVGSIHNTSVNSIINISVSNIDLLQTDLKLGSIITINNLLNNPSNLVFIVTAITSNNLTAKLITDANIVDEIDSIFDIEIKGKTTYIPLTALTDRSFTIEQWCSDISQSEVYVGNKVSSVSISIPTSGFISCEFYFIGKELQNTSTEKLLQPSTKTKTTAVTAASSNMLIGGNLFPIISADFNIDRKLQALHAIGGINASSIMQGVYEITGNFSVYLENSVLKSYFLQSVATSLVFVLSNDIDYISFAFPQVNITVMQETELSSGMIIHFSFTAVTGLNSTSMYMHDAGFLSIFEDLVYMVTVQDQYYTTQDDEMFVLKG